MALALFVAFFVVPGMIGGKEDTLPHSNRDAKPAAVASTGGARKAGGGGAKGGSGRPGGGSSTGGGKASSSSSSASSSSTRPSSSGVRQRVGGSAGGSGSGGVSRSREERAERNEVLSLLTSADGEFNEAGAEDDSADADGDDAALSLGGAVPKAAAPLRFGKVGRCRLA